MNDTSDIRAALVSTRTRFDAAIAGLPPGTLTDTPAVGVWPVRNVVAHLIDWHSELLRAAEYGLGGPRPTDHPITGDAYNDTSVARHADEPWAQLDADLGEVFKHAVTLANRCTPDELSAPAEFPWGGTGTVEELLRAIVEHQEEHNAQIEAWRATGAPV